MAKRILVFVALSAVGCARGPVVDTQQITALRTSAALPGDNPTADAWNAAPVFPATLMIQDVTEPRLEGRNDVA